MILHRPFFISSKSRIAVHAICHYTESIELIITTFFTTMTVAMDTTTEPTEVVTDGDVVVESTTENMATPSKLVGGEPCLLDPEVEEKGVTDILAALTDKEKAQIPHPDMPLRHFRACKVREREMMTQMLLWDENRMRECCFNDV
jgi:hypothetical protein